MAKNYSTTYKNKSTSGKRISIKNGIVYLNGQKAYPGYRWFDIGNDATYKVNKDGTYSHIAINGKPIRENIYSTNRTAFYIDSPKDYINSHNQNELDPDYEPSVITKFNKASASKTLKRASIEEQYFIPGYLPNVRRIKVGQTRTNSKNDYFKNIDLPVNEIDSIVKNTILANNIRIKQGKRKISLEEPFGLLHETSNGKQPSITSAKKSDYSNYTEYPFYRESKNLKGIIGYYPTDLINNHRYYTSGATDVIGSLVKQKAIDVGEHDLNIAPSFNYIIKDFDKVNREFKKPVKDNTSDNPWINGFNYFVDNNYGMGEQYKNKVKTIGKQLLTDPNIKREVNRAIKKYRNLEDN